MTSDSQDIRLQLHLDLGDDSDSEELDRATRQLRSELADAETESVELISTGQAPEGAKSAEGLLLGMLAVTVLPATLPSIMMALKNWTERARNRPRHLRISRGEGAQRVEVELDSENLSEAQLMALIEKLTQPPASGSGVAVQSGRDVVVGGDVVGRDKVTTIIHAGPASTIIVSPSQSVVLPEEQ